jgi:hypothetical protein
MCGPADSRAREQGATPRVAGAAARRVPEIFLVGHPGEAATAVCEMLQRHPQVFLPERSEPRYFAADLPSDYRPWQESAQAQTYADYLELFAHARRGERLGEASTVYIWSRVAADLIAAARPDARIIASFREPAGYVRSLHAQLLDAGTETEPDLRRALELEPARREGRELHGSLLAGRRC